MLTAVPGRPPTVGAASSGAGAPISTVTSPAGGTCTVRTPARVPIASVPGSARPASTRYRAYTRMPLPHISATEPSAFQ